MDEEKIEEGFGIIEIKIGNNLPPASRWGFKSLKTDKIGELIAVLETIKVELLKEYNKNAKMKKI